MCVEEAELVDAGVVGEAGDCACSRCYGAGVGTVIQGAEVGDGCCPWVGGVQEGRVELESHDRGGEDLDSDWYCLEWTSSI